MVKNGEKTKWADFLLWVNILLRFPPVYHVDVFNTITTNILSVAILNFIQIRHNNVPVSFFSIRIINPENIGVDTKIVILFQLQLETQDINRGLLISGF